MCGARLQRAGLGLRRLGTGPGSEGAVDRWARAPGQDTHTGLGKQLITVNSVTRRYTADACCIRSLHSTALPVRYCPIRHDAIPEAAGRQTGGSALTALRRNPQGPSPMTGPPGGRRGKPGPCTCAPARHSSQLTAHGSQLTAHDKSPGPMHSVSISIAGVSA